MVASKPTGGFLKWTHFPWSNPIICNTPFAFFLQYKRLEPCSHLLWQDLQLIQKSQHSREGSGLLTTIKIRWKSSLNGCNIIEVTIKKNRSSACLNHHTSTDSMFLSPFLVSFQCTISNYPKLFCTVTASQMRFLSCLWAGKLRHKLGE